LTGIAPKETDSPRHKGFFDGVTVMLTGRLSLAVMVIVFEVAGLFSEHVALDVSLQTTASPLAGT
jgi:hypothetical protein